MCFTFTHVVFVGDVCSILYTYSLAAYSGPMRVHSTNPKDAPSNALIAVQRRYQNMVNDPFRQTQFEMFCGVDRAKYFPSLGRATGSATVPPLEIVSDYPSCVLSRTEAATAATGKANVTTITLALRKPAVLRELLLTVSANSAGEIRPTDTCRMTLYVGPYVDALRPVFYNLVVPTVSLGVAMEYFIPSTIWGAYDEQIYPVNGTGNGMNRESTDGNNSSNKRPGKVLGAYSRFVRITFTASNSAVTVDRMELRGWPLAPGPVAMCAAAASGPAAAPEALQGYEELVTKAAQERAFDLSTALTLEVVRIDGGISPAERDEVMVRHKLSRELDPQSFVYRRDEALESRLLENTAPTEGCAECQAVADTFVCPGCRQRFCRKCGAPVLQAVPEYFLGAPRLVCKSCLPLVQRRQEMLAVQQQQVMLERVAAHSPAQFIRAQGVAEYPHPVPELCPGSSWRLRELSDMRRVETDLALFPRACFARSLPLGRDGVPPEVMLVDGSEGASWTVDGKSQLTLVVVFMVDSLVTSLDIEMTSSGNSSGGGCDDAVATVEVKAGNSLDGLDNDSGYAQTPAHGPLSVLLRGTVVAIRIIPKDPAQQLTVKRLHIRGKPSPKEELGQAGKGKDKRKDKKRKSVSSILSKRSLISQQKVEEHPGGAAPTRRVVDVFFGHGKASVIHGFGLTIPAVKDPAALPRLVRASVLQLVQRKKSKTLEPQGRIVLGTYVVPKCATAEGAVLVYNFDTPAQGNVLRLECVANYGSQEQTLLGKISLF